ETQVLVRIVVMDILQGLENFFGQPLLNLLDLTFLLQHLTRDVERKISGVNDTFDKSQVTRQEVSTLLDNQNALCVQTQSRLERVIKKFARRFRRDEEQRLVFESPFSLGRDGLPWCFSVIEKVLVKLGILIIGHFRLRANPDGLHRVQDLV